MPRCDHEQGYKEQATREGGESVTNASPIVWPSYGGSVFSHNSNIPRGGKKVKKIFIFLAQTTQICGTIIVDRTIILKGAIMRPDDPNRCQHVNSLGQCRRLAAEGATKCPEHLNSAAQKLRSYLITTTYLSDAPDRHVASEELKSLREEIALTRSLVEKRLNMIQNDAEFLAAMPAVQSAMGTIEKLVVSCHNMEVKLDNLLGKSALMNVANQIIEIISKELELVPGRNEIVDRIADKIVEVVSEASNEARP